MSKIDILQYNIPKGAQYYAASPKTGAPQMFYKWGATKFSDNTLGVGLEYYSFAGIWCGSEHNLKDVDAFVARLTPISEKVGYTVTFQEPKAGYHGDPITEFYATSEKELTLMKELILNNPRISNAFYQADRSSLAVWIKPPALYRTA